MTEQEFGNIASECSGRLKALAQRFSRSTDLAIDADDVVQEALTALWNLSEKGYPVRNAEALLVKITKNICVSHYRQHRIEIKAIADDAFISGCSASDRLEEQDAEKLRKHLYSRLTPSEQVFIRMQEERGCSLDDMSAETGRDKNVIKTLLSKARRKMKEYLKNQ